MVPGSVLRVFHALLILRTREVGLLYSIDEESEAHRLASLS